MLNIDTVYRFQRRKKRKQKNEGNEREQNFPRQQIVFLSNKQS
jgi:hypothetical protein